MDVEARLKKIKSLNGGGGTISLDDRRNPDVCGSTLEKQICQDPRHRSLLYSCLIECIRWAHSHNPGAWTLSLYKYELRLMIGNLVCFCLNQGAIWLLLDRERLTEADLEALEGRTWNEMPFESFPPGREVMIPEEEVEAQWRRVRPAMQSTIRLLCDRAGGVNTRAYSPGVLEYLEANMSIDLPRPEHRGSSSQSDSSRDELKADFSKFRRSEFGRLMVTLRRQRARQIIELFATEQIENPSFFNREVWRLETETTLRGAPIKLMVGREELDAGLVREVLEIISDEVTAGDLELHGNYTWGSGTRIFAPRLADPARIEALKSARKILNSDDPPFEKYQRLEELHGFGRNAASGLVMFFHPAEFAIFNKPSQESLASISLRAKSIEEFQGACLTLKQELGAEDMLELDAFLYFRRTNSSVFEEIARSVRDAGFRIEERTLRRYHLSQGSRGFVILSGVSGTGKTWLTRLYASAVGAEYHLEAVSPAWTTNEDLLGYYNPVCNEYQSTGTERFIRSAAEEYQRNPQDPRPYHLVLDEMNLARIEHYFAKFLSGLEVRVREGEARIELGPGRDLTLPPNLVVIGTVNIDETTHGFADKVYDRAQLIELRLDEELIKDHLADRPYAGLVLEIWRVLQAVAPFAYRVLDEIEQYAERAEEEGFDRFEAVDEQILQKVLPKIRGTDPRLPEVLQQLIKITDEHLPLSHEKLVEMKERYERYRFVSFF